jgi:hypothetical protein
MGVNINKLLTIAGPALSAEAPVVSNALVDTARTLGRELLALLQHRNGFYAFEGALHVLPAGSISSPQNLAEWNSPDVWRSAYGDQAEGLVFWAEDTFGCQFALSDDGVYRFDPETGERERVAETLEACAGRILSDYDAETRCGPRHAASRGDSTTDSRPA